ncbi:L-threonylcarbamoyladenylate synthase [Endomicrobium proavitum]|uniref:L-threonylcarbamoyladenylate synthase n=1 Tax=Endomicrobium proavitum TaxID=1408281 RepID=A0A0G3WJ28_9BACT|nr:L-threonylcarbamoyladenylate synthase [Endomicrobium proavitum]AKL98333.1 Sua5-related translation factor [Endomicrobium proavitum]
MKKTLKISHIEKDAHKKVADVIKSGGVAIVPTETVYGFAADAFNTEAKNIIYKIKGRSYKKPLVVMTPDIESVKVLVEIPQKALKIAKKFWPGQLTLIFPTTELGKILSGGRDNLGVRIPNNVFMLKLLKEIASPVWTTSVNASGKKSAKNYKDVLEFDGVADVIVDGGKCEFSFESTVIDMVKFPYVIVRKGCLNTNEILKYI